MADAQQQNHDIEVKLISPGPNGPVFEGGPGWGTKTGVFLRKYFAKIILPILIAGILIYGFATRNAAEAPGITDNLTLASPMPSDSIKQAVGRGDSKTVLARRAIIEYLNRFGAESVSAGQKVFVENKLSQEIASVVVKVGGSIEFQIVDIKNAFAESKKLTQTQLRKWEEFARRAGVR